MAPLGGGGPIAPLGLGAGGPMLLGLGPGSCLARYGFWKPLGGMLAPCDRLAAQVGLGRHARPARWGMARGQASIHLAPQGGQLVQGQPQPGWGFIP